MPSRRSGIGRMTRMVIRDRRRAGRYRVKEFRPDATGSGAKTTGYRKDSVRVMVIRWRGWWKTRGVGDGAAALHPRKATDGSVASVLMPRDRTRPTP